MAFFFSAIVPAIVGCGRSDLPELGRVQGTVTLDGKPLSGAAVGFYPLSGGRQALSIIDEDGKYELTFVDGVDGAQTVRRGDRLLARRHGADRADPSKVQPELGIDV